jgi:hypothetical protein
MMRRWTQRTTLLIGALVALAIGTGWSASPNRERERWYMAGGPSETEYKQLWDLEPNEVVASAGGLIGLIGSVVTAVAAMRLLQLRRPHR